MMRQVEAKPPEFKVGDIVRIITDLSDIYSYKDVRCFVEEIISKERISLYSLDSPLKDSFGYSKHSWYVGDFNPSDLAKIGDMTMKDVENYEHYLKVGDMKRILDTMKKDSDIDAWKG